MRYWTLTEWLMAGGAFIVGLGVYVYIWNRSKIIASVILLLAFAWVAYTTLDWTYWDVYFKVDWGSGGLTPPR
ncbi:MAG: hypothetical protein KDD69_17905 [Bdellovibrionales bacterium]|nr:hypothetical protein [Bdellovibrionales bacterium]